MTPAARISAVIDLLDRIAHSRVPMDTTIGDYMRGRRYIGSKDRAYIAGTLYAMMRAHARLGWWCGHSGVEDSPRMRTLVWLVMGEGLNRGQIKSRFDGSIYGPAALSADEEGLIGKLQGQAIDHGDMPDHIRLECPEDYAPRLRELWGPDFGGEMRALLDPAPLDLRVNTLLVTREKAREMLEEDGVACAPTPYSPHGLRLADKAHLSKTRAFTKGLVEIQDEGSQLIALAANPFSGGDKGAQVLDYCAGAGGKTLALAAAMGGKGRIVAMDSDEKRLDKARQRLRRAKAHDMIEVRALSDEKNRKWLRRQKGKFDVVLTDVPCSGTGTWRRNPDLRWYAHGPALHELAEIQQDILARAAPCVKPGGVLVYATCSLLAEENEAQIEWALHHFPEFEIRDVTRIWPDNAPCPVAGPFMRLTPRQHNTDGFFAAVLQRRETEIPGEGGLL